MHMINVATGLISMRNVPKNDIPKHWMKLVMPKTPPRNAPAQGPRATAPIATGIMRRETSMVPDLKYPIGVKDMRIMSAVKMPINAIDFVF